MPMSNRVLILPLFGLIALANASAPLNYRLDSNNSSVSAKVSFLGVGSRSAQFPKMYGSVVIVPEQPQRAKIDVTFDASALTSSDSSTTSRLKGEKFFWVSKYPNVRFVGTSLKMSNATEGTVTGQLTARGTTRDETLKVKFTSNPMTTPRGQAISFTGTTTIDRRKYGMKSYQLVVGNNVNITLKARMVPR
jgi:polyisoprenoid-binding protein YceI